MKFNKIIFITLLLLTVLSISAVSAENNTNVISDEIDIDNDVVLQSPVENPIIGDTNVTTSDAVNSSDENTTTENNSTIISSDVVKYYKNATRYEATFLNTNGTPLSNSNVSINVNKVTYTRTTDANGKISFALNLQAGTYNLTATNLATNESVVNTVTILPTIKGKDITKYYRNGTQFYVDIVDGEGKAVDGKSVNFNINGVFYNRTATNGTARLNINLNPGKYVITTTNLDNGEKISNNIIVLSTITGKDITKYYKNATQYYINVTDAQGKPANNQTINFNINGVFYNRTATNGTARLNINLEPGKYTLTAVNLANGERISNTITVNSKITAKNANSGGNISIEYNNKDKYTVTLHNDNGSLAVNKTVSFNINGVVYKRTTDVNGTASLTINLFPGNYVVTTEFENAKLSNTLKVRVTPDIKLLTTSLKSGSNVKFQLTEHLSKNPITGDHVGIVSFNNTAYGNYPDKDGIVQIGVGLPAGSYIFYFGMADDGWYSSKYIGNSITVTA